MKAKLLGVSAIISLLFLTVTFIVTDYAVPMSSEKMLFKKFEIIKDRLRIGKNKSHELNDSVLIIDTHYAQTMVQERNEGLPTGNVPVTNRDLLKNFLSLIKEKGDYKFILLDIVLDENVAQPEDSVLHDLILSMPRIIIAKPGKFNLADTLLNPKAGRVSYYQTQWEGDFVKYPYLIEGEKSMPLKAYEESSGRSLERNGIIYSDRGLARKSLFLTYDFFQFEQEDYLIHYLDDENFSELDTKDKYILIGDLEDDRHPTYIGNIPGVLINYNAYLALSRGHHIVKPSMLVILFLAFLFLAYQTLIQSNLTWLFMWIGYPAYLTFTCFIIFFLYGEVYDILITTSLFYFLKTCVGCYRDRELLRSRIGEIKLLLKRLLIKFGFLKANRQ